MTHSPAPLHKLLLVGTARARFSADALAPELAAVVQPALDMPGTTAERQLWLAAAAQRLWVRAGYTAAAAAAGADAVTSSPEQLSACPRGAESILKQLLHGSEPAPLLLEWLNLLNSRQARLPERFLPNMLERATRDAALRACVRATLGTRGLWLARHEAAWSWAGASTDTGNLLDAWQNGTPEERAAALLQWRHIDPAAAREALQSCWASEGPDGRIAFLPCLGIGLNASDESFLEAALDDRRKGVRVAAQRLLARLPGSALSQRMLARVATLLPFEKRFLRANQLTVTLPAECDAAMARDGVGESTHPGLGEKAGWVADMLAAVAPSHWSATFGLPPDECIALSASTDYQQAILLGWSAAIRLHLEGAPAPDLLAWLAAWTRFLLKSDRTASHQNAVTGLVATYKSLPAPTMHAALFELVAASPAPWRAPDSALVDLLERLADGSAPWPAALSHATAQRLLGALPSLSSQHWSFRSVLPRLATVLDPAAVIAAECQWPGMGADPHDWQGLLDQFFHVVRFRHAMILSFQEPA